MEAYDPLTDAWLDKPTMLEDRALHGAAALDGKIYVVGGVSLPSAVVLDSWEVCDANGS